ncbi:MAG: hypothetical protein KC421_17415, partial [Anaerolineales bacterium]|nr:hypothetical protein [Anaerolineales bacterium]
MPVAYWGDETFWQTAKHLRRTDFNLRVGRPFILDPGEQHSLANLFGSYFSNLIVPSLMMAFQHSLANLFGSYLCLFRPVNVKPSCFSILWRIFLGATVTLPRRGFTGFIVSAFSGESFWELPQHLESLARYTLCFSILWR